MSEEIKERLIDDGEFESTEYDSPAKSISSVNMQKENDHNFKLNHDLEKILNLLFHLEKTFEEKIKLDVLKERFFENITHELDFFKENFIAQSQKPLFYDLAQFNQHFTQIVEQIQPQLPPNLSEEFSLLQKELKTIFKRYSVDIHPS